MSPIAKMITFKLKRWVCSKFAINQAQNVLVGTQAAAFCCGFYNFAVTFRNEYGEPVVVLLVELRPVHVEHHGEDEDEGPVEVFRASDADGVHHRPGFGRAVSPEFEHVGPSLFFLRRGAAGLYEKSIAQRAKKRNMK